TWVAAGSAAAGGITFLENGLNEPSVYFYRVAATNDSGKSRYSNVASTRPGATTVASTFVGGTLTANTTWTPAMGMIIVQANVIVPTNVVLTIAAGSNVKITNG